jgi:hypothetical protein
MALWWRNAATPAMAMACMSGVSHVFSKDFWYYTATTLFPAAPAISFTQLQSIAWQRWSANLDAATGNFQPGLRYRKSLQANTVLVAFQ